MTTRKHCPKCIDPENRGLTPIIAQSADFEAQVAKYFNDTGPLLSFEKYRRRRVIFEPVAWRRGEAELPVEDSEGVQ